MADRVNASTIRRLVHLLLMVFFWLQVTRFFVQWGFFVANSTSVLPLSWGTTEGITVGFPESRSFLLFDGLTWLATALIGVLTMSKRWWIPVLSIIALWGGYEVVLATYSPPDSITSPIRELEGEFSGREGKLNSIVSMAKEDTQAKWITCKFVDPSTAVSKERWEKYCELLKGANVDGISVVEGLDIDWLLPAIEVQVSRGKANAGYAYSQRKPKTLVNSFEGVSPTTPKPVFKRLADNWYVYYVWVGR